MQQRIIEGDSLNFPTGSYREVAEEFREEITEGYSVPYVWRIVPATRSPPGSEICAALARDAEHTSIPINIDFETQRA